MVLICKKESTKLSMIGVNFKVFDSMISLEHIKSWKLIEIHIKRENRSTHFVSRLDLKPLNLCNFLFELI